MQDVKVWNILSKQNNECGAEEKKIFRPAFYGKNLTISFYLQEVYPTSI